MEHEHKEVLYSVGEIFVTVKNLKTLLDVCLRSFGTSKVYRANYSPEADLFQ